MSTFENDDFRWRETYFVLFSAAKRPTLNQVEGLLRGLNQRFQLTHTSSDDEGHFESLTLLAPDDFAAVDISYLEGEEVLEQGALLTDELKSSPPAEVDRRKLARLADCDARFEIMHFQQVMPDEDEDELDGMFDPSALLIVLDALVQLTDGIGIDPQSGSML
ncbi:MAG: hypothetical protein HY000_01135 [Planctomycetes bacterium]|nr:hypothetical protein [Planctomycetota bacterium]